MATPKRYIEKDKIVTSKGVVESSLSLRYAYDDGCVKPPSMRKMLHAETHAMYFQHTSVTNTADNTFLVACESVILAGKVVQVQNCTMIFAFKDADIEVLNVVPPKPAVTTWVLDSAPLAFEKFMKYYEKGIPEPSITVDGKYCKYTISAVDSPFFYPLSATDIKYLSQSGGRQKNHAKYLHDQISQYWDEIVQVVDPVISGYRMNLYRFSEHTVLEKNSVLFQMITAILDATRVGSAAHDIMVYDTRDTSIYNTVRINKAEAGF